MGGLGSNSKFLTDNLSCHFAFKKATPLVGWRVRAQPGNGQTHRNFDNKDIIF